MKTRPTKYARYKPDGKIHTYEFVQGAYRAACNWTDLLADKERRHSLPPDDGSDDYCKNCRRRRNRETTA